MPEAFITVEFYFIEEPYESLSGLRSVIETVPPVEQVFPAEHHLFRWLKRLSVFYLDVETAEKVTNSREGAALVIGGVAKPGPYVVEDVIIEHAFVNRANNLVLKVVLLHLTENTTWTMYEQLVPSETTTYVELRRPGNIVPNSE